MDFLKLVLVLVLAAIWIMMTGCSLLRPPAVNAGYYIENKPDSKTTVLIGTNNTQANAIHAAIGETKGAADGEKAEAEKAGEGTAGQMATSSGLFVNNNVGDRSAEVDATAALEMLKDVQGTSAGQAQTTSKGNESPSTGTQSQTPSNTQTDTTTLALPVAIGQSAPTATANQSRPANPIAGSGTIKDVFVPDTVVPDGLKLSLDEWNKLKENYIKCPECLALSPEEEAALKAAVAADQKK